MAADNTSLLAVCKIIALLQANINFEHLLQPPSSTNGGEDLVVCVWRVCFLSAPQEQRRLYGYPFKEADGRKLATGQAW